MNDESDAAELLADTIIDSFELLRAGQAMSVPPDLAEPGQERAFMFALVDACRRRAIPLAHVLAPAHLVRPAAFENAEGYEGVHLIQNPDDEGKIILVRG